MFQSNQLAFIPLINWKSLSM